MVAGNSNPTGLSSAGDLHSLLTRHGYIAKAEIAKVLYLALRLGKPLLLEGPPGAGKTQIAKVLSDALGMELIRLQCYDGIDEAKALYEWNEPLQRMALEFIRENSGESRTTWPELKRHLYSTDFLVPGPILRALQCENTAVLLIDEIDKTGPSFEAFLLEILSDFQVSISQLGSVVARHRPIVVLTSNAQRKLTDALRGRCFLLWMDYPAPEHEVEIIAARSRDVEPRLSSQVARFTAAVRHLGMTKPPAIRESLDWIDALRLLGATELTADVVGSTLPVLLKTREDIDRAAGNVALLLQRSCGVEAKPTIAQ
jgi:MoxR-like ATPase